MQDTSVKQEILELENQYWRALKDKDFDTAMRLTDDNCIVAGSQGVSAIDKTTFEEMMNAQPYSLDDYKLDDAQVRMVSDDVAVVAYQVHEELTVEGQPVTLEAADASTWVRRNGAWRCALHTESVHGDPFGRDRNRNGNGRRVTGDGAKRPRKAKRRY